MIGSSGTSYYTKGSRGAGHMGDRRPKFSTIALLRLAGHQGETDPGPRPQGQGGGGLNTMNRRAVEKGSQICAQGIKWAYRQRKNRTYGAGCGKVILTREFNFFPLALPPQSGVQGNQPC